MCMMHPYINICRNFTHKSLPHDLQNLLFLFLSCRKHTLVWSNANHPFNKALYTLAVCKNAYANTETEAYLRHVYTDSNVLTTSCEDDKKKAHHREREREGEREREREKVREDAAADFRLSHLARDCGSIYLASDGCDIYGRKKPFQGFEGMAEALRWRLWLRPGQRWSWLGLGPLGIGEALWSQWWLRVFCPDTLTKKLRERKPTCVRVCVRLASRVSLLCLHHTYMYCMHAQPHTHTHTEAVSICESVDGYSEGLDLAP